MSDGGAKGDSPPGSSAPNRMGIRMPIRTENCILGVDNCSQNRTWNRTRENIKRWNDHLSARS
jgi:hypothetical protein